MPSQINSAPPDRRRAILRRQRHIPNLPTIGFRHLENRLKNRDLDDRRFWKRLYYGPSPNVDKTRVFRTGRPLIKRCVHPIAGDRALLPPSPRRYVLSKPGWADATPQDLTPASGRQDHTILPYAATSLVSVLVIAHRLLKNPPCGPSRAQRCRVHRNPPPRFATAMTRPSCGVGWRGVVEMICPTGEAKYFCKRGWTRLSTNRPTGKSLEPVLLSIGR